MCYLGVFFGWVVLMLERVFDNGFHAGSDVVDVLYSYLACVAGGYWWRFGDVACVLCDYALSFRDDGVA